MCSNSNSPVDSIKRILMVRLGAMGDIIQTLPAAAELKRCFPSASVSWAVEERWTALLEEHPHVDELIAIPLKRLRKTPLNSTVVQEFSAMLSALSSPGFDLAIDFQGLIKSAMVARLTHAACIFGFERNQLRENLAALFYNRFLFSTSTHVVDRYRELASFAANTSPAPDVIFHLPNGIPKNDLPERYVLVSPAAGWQSKQWPLEYYGELADLLWKNQGIPMLVDCVPGKESAFELIQTRTSADAVVIHPSSIEQLIAATRKATAVVGVDSGPLHIAAALERPGVAIFGPTDPARNGPYGSSLSVLRHEHAKTTYKRETEISASMCAISPQQVYERLSEIIP